MNWTPLLHKLANLILSGNNLETATTHSCLCHSQKMYGKILHIPP
jgi:hypothetical protein